MKHLSRANDVETRRTHPGVAERFNMQDAKSVSTPTDSAFNELVLKGYLTEEERKHMKSVPYREIIGCLLYVANRTGSGIR